jgi:hypothetical protein
MARPSSYSVKVADTICERLAEGKSLNSICASDDMPHKATVFRWISFIARGRRSRSPADRQSFVGEQRLYSPSRATECEAALKRRSAGNTGIFTERDALMLDAFARCQPR